MSATENAPSVYPTLRYNDASAAVRFLEQAFGLVPSQMHTGPDGAIVHAELSWGNGVIMLSSRRQGADDPFDAGRACLYLATTDPDKIHERAVGAGATIVQEPVDQEYGSREFAARDPEGNVWSFGTYRPHPTSPS